MNADGLREVSLQLVNYCNRDGLRSVARALEIKGRSRFNKEALKEAITSVLKGEDTMTNADGSQTNGSKVMNVTLGGYVRVPVGASVSLVVPASTTPEELNQYTVPIALSATWTDTDSEEVAEHVHDAEIIEIVAREVSPKVRQLVREHRMVPDSRYWWCSYSLTEPMGFTATTANSHGPCESPAELKGILASEKEEAGKG